MYGGLRSARTLRDVRGTRVLVRVDYNTEFQQGKPLETERIDRSMELVHFLITKGAKIILVTHLGRPDGKRDKRYSVKPLVPYIKKASGTRVTFVDDCIGPKVDRAAAALKSGEILLLENVRFYEEETENNTVFAHQLASLAEAYINEAFSNCHRAHASIAAITHFLPAYAGFNLEREVVALHKVMASVRKPSVAVLGGAKVSDKIKVIESLARTHSRVLLGGALAHTFFAAKGIPLSHSLYEKDQIPEAKRLLKAFGKKLVLPVDVLIVDMSDRSSSLEYVRTSALKKHRGQFHIVDIGPKTAALFAKYLKTAKDIVWNGPMGMFEDTRFNRGTLEVGSVLADRAHAGAYAVVGGGETITALKLTGKEEWVDFISTGGGAMLEFLEGKVLPGIKPLLVKSKI